MNRFSNDLDSLCRVYSQKFGETIYPRHSIVVSTDGAFNLMRELMTTIHPKISFNADDDVLFNFDRAPVRLRHSAPPGQAIVMAHVDVPARKCCDQTAMTTIMLALNKGNA